MPTHIALPAFDDNYIWLLQDVHTRQCAAVDPGDPEPVLQWLAANPGWSLSHILITHHHRDHTGGVLRLKETTGAKVLGPALETIAGIDQPLQDGDRIEAAGYALQVMHVPGHTLGHIAYVHAGERPFVLSGDTLFAGGCGRLFEGSPQQMHQSLQQLAGLPDDCQLYCTHEYTLSNLKFAVAVEPGNARLAERLQQVIELRQQGISTLPSTMELERATNPFLRCDQPGVLASLRQQRNLESTDSCAAFACLRAWKDVF